MIQSKINTSRVRIILIATVMVAILFVAVCTLFILNRKLPGLDESPVILYSFLSLSLLFSLVFLISQLWRDAKHITIDGSAKTITFTHFFTKKQTLYSFSDFDGFVDMYQDSKQGSFRVIYLVQDKKYKEKISSFYCANLDELQEALHPIKYLGTKTFSFWKSLKIFLGKEVLK